MCGREAAADDSERVCGGGSIRGGVRGAKLVGCFVEVSVLDKYFSGSLLFGGVGAGHGSEQLLGNELPGEGVGGASDFGATGTTRDEISHLTEYVVQLQVHGERSIGLRCFHIVRIGRFKPGFCRVHRGDLKFQIQDLRFQISNFRVQLSDLAFQQLIRDGVSAENFPQHFHHPARVHRDRPID